jgi:hypothetical protein
MKKTRHGHSTPLPRPNGMSRSRTFVAFGISVLGDFPRIHPLPSFILFPSFSAFFLSLKIQKRKMARPLGVLRSSSSTRLSTVLARASSSLAYANYADTIPNLGVQPDSRVMVQGFTGKAVSILHSTLSTSHALTGVIIIITQSTSHSKIAIDFGTNIVGGVSPNKGGQTHLDLPVYSTVREVNLSACINWGNVFFSWSYN